MLRIGDVVHHVDDVIIRISDVVSPIVYARRREEPYTKLSAQRR